MNEYGTWKACFFIKTPGARNTPEAVPFCCLHLPDVCCCTCSKGLRVQLLSVTSDPLYLKFYGSSCLLCLGFVFPQGNSCTFQVTVGCSFYLVILISVNVNDRKLKNLKGLWRQLLGSENLKSTKTDIGLLLCLIGLDAEVDCFHAQNFEIFIYEMHSESVISHASIYMHKWTWHNFQCWRGDHKM